MQKSKKHLTEVLGMKSDGNGGFIIQKGTFAAITLLIMFLTFVSTVVAYGVTIKSDVAHLQDAYEQVATDHKPWAEDVNTRIAELETNKATTALKLDDMHDDIKEIKLDIKEHFK